MMKNALTLVILMLAQFVWAQPRVDVSAINYYEDPSGTISFDLVFEATRTDTVFLAFGDIIFDADWSQFSNPSVSVTSLGYAKSRGGNTNISPGFIRFGQQQNSDKVIFSIDPKFIDQTWQFRDNVIALDRGTSYAMVHIEVNGYNGILDPNFGWVTSGNGSDNTSNVHAFSTKTPKYVTQQAELRFTDFPSLGSPRLNITTFLEGAYDTTTNEMRTDLNNQGLLPLMNPYAAAPWNYTGGDSVAAIPNSDIVDWVLVEIRETNGASNAGSSTAIGRRAGFLLKNGTIVDLDGSSYLEMENVTFDTTKTQFVVVYHRNHLALMSGSGLVYNDSVPPIARWECDMTNGLATLYGGSNGAKLKDGVTMMMAGDASSDGNVQNSDRNLVWYPLNGTGGYTTADFNMNGQVQNDDAELLWYVNNGKSKQVP